MFSGASPCLEVEFPKLNNQVTEHLDADQLQRLLNTLAVWPDRMSSSFVMFLLHTGLRRGELFKLRWEDIDMERRLIILRDPKGKVDTTLPLSNKAVDVLRCIPRDYETEYVFYGKGGQQRVDFSGPWKRIRKAAGLPNNFRLHGLRHHFASALVSDGVDIYTVSKLLTHKDIKTTQRYAHLADKALRDAVNRSDELLSENGTGKIIDLYREQVND
jgi:integrase